MTRTEIDELIEYLEKNYHVKCSHSFSVSLFSGSEEYLKITPTLELFFRGANMNKETIINKLDKLDLIRF